MKQLKFQRGIKMEEDPSQLNLRLKKSTVGLKFYYHHPTAP